MRAWGTLTFKVTLNGMLVTVTQAFGVPLSTRHEFSLCPLPFGQHKSCSGSGLLLSALNLQVVFANMGWLVAHRSDGYGPEFSSCTYPSL